MSEEPDLMGRLDRAINGVDPYDGSTSWTAGDIRADLRAAMEKIRDEPMRPTQIVLPPKIYESGRKECVRRGIIAEGEPMTESAMNEMISRGIAEATPEERDRLFDEIDRMTNPYRDR